jgi:DNA-binding IclR family transcriptional regulator
VTAPVVGGGTGPVALRALRTLGAFTPDHPSLSLTEIARRAGVPLTTAHRLVAVLAEWGALERDSSGRYHVGLRLWELGSLAPRGLGLRELALPFMEDLSQVTHENVQLAVRDGVESVYVERIAGRSAIRVLTRVGGRFPLHPTGVGRVLLAHAPVEVQQQVLESPLQRFTPWTVTSPATLRSVLAEVRRSGYAVNDREVTPDALSVAAPVRGPDGGVLAALSLVVRADGASAAALAPLVMAGARGISRVVSEAAVTDPLS